MATPGKPTELTWVCTDCGRTRPRGDFDDIIAGGVTKKVCSDEAGCRAYQLR